MPTLKMITLGNVSCVSCSISTAGNRTKMLITLHGQGFLSYVPQALNVSRDLLCSPDDVRENMDDDATDYVSVISPNLGEQFHHFAGQNLI